MSLPIFKFKDETTAQKAINFWVKTHGINKEWIIIQEYNEKLSKQISIQGWPIEGKC